MTTFVPPAAVLPDAHRPDPTPGPRPRRTTTRVGAVALLAVALSVAGAASASAHVRVHPDSTTSGSFSELTFRVPTESATAGTVKVEVQLPQDTPFLSVSTRPLTGWTATTTEAALPKPVESEGATITKAVRTVTWTAVKGTQVAPEQYQEFAMSVGPLPAPGTVLLPATQTYSDGEVVTWDQPTPASGEEPEHPAPALVVTAAAASVPAAADVVTTAGGSDPVARGLGVVALVVAAAGLVLAVLGRRRAARG